MVSTAIGLGATLVVGLAFWGFKAKVRELFDEKIISHDQQITQRFQDFVRMIDDRFKVCVTSEDMQTAIQESIKSLPCDPGCEPGVISGIESRLRTMESERKRLADAIDEHNKLTERLLAWMEKKKGML